MSLTLRTTTMYFGKDFQRLIVLFLFIGSIFGLSRGAYVNTSISSAVNRVGSSLTITVDFFPTTYSDGLDTLKCGYELGGAAFVTLAVWSLRRNQLEALTSGFPASYNGRFTIPSAKVMQISNLKFEDEGTKYHCEMKYELSSTVATMISSSVPITQIYDLPVFNPNTISNTTAVVEGRSHVLICNVTSRPASEVSWWYDSAITATQSNYTATNGYYTFSIGMLSIQNVTSSIDGRIAGCTGTPVYGNPINTCTTLMIGSLTAAPQNFTVRSTSSSSLKLNWKPPPPEYTNGIIRYYLVKYQQVNCDYGSAINDTVSNTTLAEGTWNITKVNGSSQTWTLRNLKYWSCYDVQIAAVTVSEGVFARINNTRTSEHAPTAAAQEFTVWNTSSSSLELNWKPPPPEYTNGIIRHYLVKYQRVHCDYYSGINTSWSNTSMAENTWNIIIVNESLRSVNLTNLNYWSCYDVQIAAFTVSEGVFVRINNTRTSEHAPTAAPQDLTVLNTSSSSLELNWNPPSPEYTNGIIRHYLVNYRRVHCSTTNDSAINDTWSNTFLVEKTWNMTTVDESLRSVNLTNLRYWSCYDVQLAAVTVSEGVFARINNTRTSEHAPTAAPQNFTVDISSSTSLQLTWQPPPSDKMNGIIRNYLIRYQKVHCDTGFPIDAFWNSTTVVENAQSVNLTGLSYWTCYKMQIAAVTVSEGEFSTVNSTRTSEYAPTTAPQNFTVRSISSSSLKLNWKPPPPELTNGIIRHYLVKYRRVNCDYGSAINDIVSNTTLAEGTWNIIKVNGSSQTWTLTDLEYWSCYDVQIAAFTVSEGVFARINNTRTSEHAPTAAPENFTVRNTSSSSLELNWKPPAPEYTNGVIRHYLVKYRKVNCDYYSGINYMLSNTTVAENTWNTIRVDESLRSVNLTNLEYWSCYDVQIAAFTVSEGVFVRINNTRTSEHAPTASPQNFTAHNLSSTSLKLSWEPPPTKYTHGFIRYYLIKFQRVRCDNGSAIDASWNYTTAYKDERSKILTNLTFWSCYDIEIAAVTVGEGKFAKIIKRRSSENAPTAPPQNFIVANESSSSLVLSWIPPLADRRHGLIRKYVIKYRVVGCSDVAARDSYWNTTTVGGEQRSTRIANLLHWTCYNVKIAALTVEEGPFANVTVRTSENAPTAEPESFEVTNTSSSSLQLKWEPPQEKLTHGSIRYYVIKFRVVDCSTGSSDAAVWNITTVKSDLRNTTIGGLLFWTCYDVKIAAVTVGQGPFASKKKVRTSKNDPCTKLRPCRNNATCRTDTNGMYSCSCTPGYTGRNCTINIDECQSNPCGTNGICIDSMSSYQCICNDTFTGKNCEAMIDPCTTANCTNGVCIGQNKTYSCNCYGGYTGKYCDTLIDECSLQPNGVCNEGMCVSRNGTFFCNCSDGYAGRRCEVDQWPCRSNPCFNGGKCTDIRVDSAFEFSCKCSTEFEGDRCERRKPKPCDQKPCENGATCVERGGQLLFECVCKAGYGGKTCQYFYGDTAVSVTLKLEKSKAFNETVFRLAIAKKLNDFCVTTPNSCPTINSNGNSPGRYRRDSSKSYVFKSSDIKFLPGYPKIKPDGSVVVRFFVIVTVSSGASGNSTASPGALNAMDPNTVKKSLEVKSDLSSFGFKIQSVKVVKTMKATKADESGISKILVVVIAVLSVVFVTGLLVLACKLFSNSRRMSIEVTKRREYNTERNEHRVFESQTNHAYENCKKEIGKPIQLNKIELCDANFLQPVLNTKDLETGEGNLDYEEIPAEYQNYAELSPHGREPEHIYAGLTNIVHKNVEENTRSTYENIRNMNVILERTQPT